MGVARAACGFGSFRLKGLVRGLCTLLKAPGSLQRRGNHTGREPLTCIKYEENVVL